MSVTVCDGDNRSWVELNIRRVLTITEGCGWGAVEWGKPVERGVAEGTGFPLRRSAVAMRRTRLDGFGLGDHGNPTRPENAGRCAGTLDAL